MVARWPSVIKAGAMVRMSLQRANRSVSSTSVLSGTGAFLFFTPLDAPCATELELQLTGTAPVYGLYSVPSPRTTVHMRARRAMAGAVLWRDL